LIDLVLGDTLLKKLKLNYNGVASSPPPISPRKTVTVDTSLSTETLYSVSDVTLKVILEYPSLTAVRVEPSKRLAYLREKCGLKIFMKEFLHATPSCEAPSIIFGPPVSGYHFPLFREGIQDFHTIAELEALASKNHTIVGIKERNKSVMARFQFSTTALSNLLLNVENRIRDISTLNYHWSPQVNPSTCTNHPSLPCDREFLSQWVLIGNLDPSAFKSTDKANLREQLTLAAENGLPFGMTVDASDMEKSFSGPVSHIRPSSLGLDESLSVRSLKVVKLQAPVVVGISLGGGERIINRIHINKDNVEGRPIYLTRQFLTDGEASLLLAAETNNLDVCIAMSRRLTKRVEVDDLKSTSGFLLPDTSGTVTIIQKNSF
jgi:hypothetical protein